MVLTFAESSCLPFSTLISNYFVSRRLRCALADPTWLIVRVCTYVCTVRVYIFESQKITRFLELDATGTGYTRCTATFSLSFSVWLCAPHTQSSGEESYRALRKVLLPNGEKKWRGRDPAGIREILRMRPEYYPRILSVRVSVRCDHDKMPAPRAPRISQHYEFIHRRVRADASAHTYTSYGRREMRPTDPHAVSITRRICNWNYSLGTIGRTLGKNSNFERSSRADKN